MLLRIWTASLLGATAAVLADSIRVGQGQLQLINSLGSTLASHPFTADKSVTQSFDVGSGDTLKLSFLILGTDDEPLQPKQAELLWEPDSQIEKDQPGRWYKQKLRVRKGGKAKLEIDFARAPSELLALSKNKVNAFVLLGTDGYEGRVEIPLGSYTFSSDIALPYPYPPDEDLPPSWNVQHFKHQPEMIPAKAAPPKQVRTVYVLFGLALVSFPWLVAFSLASRSKPSMKRPTANMIAFIACIVSFECLYVAYWIGLRLIPTLPYFAVLALVTAFTGRRALSDVRRRRLAAEKKVE